MNPFSSFLHPEPDVFTVLGKDNQPFWLILFVRFNALDETQYVYYISVVLEIFLSTFGYFVHGRCIGFLIKHRILHLNFMAIVLNFYVFMIIGSLVRLVLLIYETELVQVQGYADWPIPLLCSIRYAALLQALFFLAFVGVERLCATVFVADYEKHRRLHISAILISSVFALSMSLAYACVTGWLNCYMVVALGFLPNILTAIKCLEVVDVSQMHHRLLNYNRRRHRHLNEAIRKHSIDEYSLSLRVQLKENIWSLEKVEFGLYVLTVGVLLDVAVIFVPVLIVADPSSPSSTETIQLWTCAANVVLAISIATSTPAGPVIIAMHTGRHPRYLRWYLGESRTQSVSDGRGNNMDVYFTQLHKQWTRRTTMHS